MREDTRAKLLAINQAFYRDFADPFAGTRAHPQPGFERLIDFVPRDCSRVLDVGCGEGRFGRFLIERRPDIDYVGVDTSADLLSHAAEALQEATLLRRDVSQPGSLSDLGTFDLVACLAVLQHIPGQTYRVRLLQEMSAQMAPGGRMVLSTWQFMQSARQKRKLIPWSAVGLSDTDVEPHDHLVAWRAGGSGMRYVAYIAEQELRTLAHSASLSLVETFRSDGREGDLNLYAVLQHGVE